MKLILILIERLICIVCLNVCDSMHANYGGWTTKNAVATAKTACSKLPTTNTAKNEDHKRSYTMKNKQTNTMQNQNQLSTTIYNNLCKNNWHKTVNTLKMSRRTPFARHGQTNAHNPNSFDFFFKMKKYFVTPLGAPWKMGNRASTSGIPSETKLKLY